MKKHVLSWRSAVISILATVATGALSSAYAAGPIVEPGDSVSLTGKTYSQWSAAWWTYYLQIPLAQNPGFDPTGASCGYMQVGNVWFLMGTAGGSVTRTQCRVPAGKYLFFPLVTKSLFHKTENENGLTGFLQAAVRATHEIHASVDGTSVSSLVTLDPRSSPLRAASPPGYFPVVAVDDNIFGGVPGQIYDTAADGFYLMVAPLAPGRHTINFGGSTQNFTTDTTYILTVE